MVQPVMSCGLQEPAKDNPSCIAMLCKSEHRYQHAPDDRCKCFAKDEHGTTPVYPITLVPPEIWAPPKWKYIRRSATMGLSVDVICAETEFVAPELKWAFTSNAI